MTVNNTRFSYGHVCSLFFDVGAISVEALIMAVDRRVKVLVAK
jgi:hypothetical protein